MQHRTLGKTGLEVSEIGLGCWQFGGDFGPMEDDRALATMAAASEAGVTFFDTADVYGGGRSESLVGRYAAAAPSPPTVATKVGRSAALFPDSITYDAVRDHLLTSAERLGVDRLDLVQLHCIPTEVLRRGAAFDIMDRLAAEGLTRFWGASVETIEEAAICLRREGCATLQIIFNLFRQDAVEELFPRAAQADVGIIIRLPLASGVLSGKFAADQAFAATDHRNYNRDGQSFSVGETFSGIPFARAVALAEGLHPFVPEGWSMVDLALRWILDHPAVSTVVAGASRPEQVTGNARASSLPPLADEVRAALAAYYRDEVAAHIRGGV